MKQRSKEVGVSDLFNNAVFGDNTTIVVGDSNKQSVNNSVVKNDLASLFSVLREHGVSTEDISDLEKAIQVDSTIPQTKEGTFGDNVSGWIGRMVSKAATTAWNVKVGAAGSLLATAIGRYYGF